MREIKRIFVHCTASSQKWGVKELLAEFKAKGWKDPGYHKVVTATHKKEVNELTTVEDVEKFDITECYPSQLEMMV